MNISWVVHNRYAFDLVINLETIKGIGPIWGAHTTWRTCHTDNVICYDHEQVDKLVAAEFYKQCNFYVPKNLSKAHWSPEIKFFEGVFDIDLTDPESIIALHLASTQNDIVLMLGFDLGKPKSQEHAQYLGVIRSLIFSSHIQWVVVDNQQPLDKAFQTLSNVTCDSLANIIQLLHDKNIG